MDRCGELHIEAIGSQMNKNIDEKDPITLFIYKMSLEQEEQDFHSKLKNQAVEGFEKDYSNAKTMQETIQKHTPYCHEFHKKMFMEDFKGVTIGIKENRNPDDNLDVDSYVIMDLAEQHPNLIGYLLEYRIPELYGMEIIGFEHLQKADNSKAFSSLAKTLFTKIMPTKMSKLNLQCSTKQNSVEFDESMAKKFIKILQNTLSRTLILKKFKMTDKVFNMIIQNCSNLENVLIYDNDVHVERPAEFGSQESSLATDFNDVMNIDVRPLTDSRKLLTLNISDNNFPDEVRVSIRDQLAYNNFSANITLSIE